MGALEALPSRPQPHRPASTRGLDDVLRLAAVVADGGMFGPYKGRPEAAATVMLQALELGLSPLQGLTSIHLVEGKPCLSAQMMRALVFAAGHDIGVVEMTDQLCRLVGRRRGQTEPTGVAFSMAEARRAGVTGRSAWKAYPQAMLLARATTLLCRTLFPDVLAGVAYTPEELDHHVDGDDLDVAIVEVVAERASAEQLETVNDLQRQLALDDVALATGLAAATDGRAHTLAELSCFDADLVIARMARRAGQEVA